MDKLQTLGQNFNILRFLNSRNIVFRALPFGNFPRSLPSTRYYHDAFFTPGIKPFDAISRNWIRLKPNWRM